MYTLLIGLIAAALTACGSNDDAKQSKSDDQKTAQTEKQKEAQEKQEKQAKEMQKKLDKLLLPRTVTMKNCTVYRLAGIGAMVPNYQFTKNVGLLIYV